MGVVFGTRSKGAILPTYAVRVGGLQVGLGAPCRHNRRVLRGKHTIRTSIDA